MLKKVKGLTVEELIMLGKAAHVRDLRITIDGTDNPNKHFDVNIGGTFYGRRLSLEDEVVVPDIDNLRYILLWKLKHRYGKVKFIDKNEQLIQVRDIEDTPNIATVFYSEWVAYNELLPTDNPYRDEVVACIQFLDKDLNQLKKLKDGK